MRDAGIISPAPGAPARTGRPAGREASGTPGGAVFTVLLFAAAAVLHGFSAMLLSELGFSYETPGGSPLSKVHPGTVALVIGLLVTMLASARPFAWTESAIARYPGTFVFLAAVLAMMGHCALVLGVPFTNFIDTFVGPIVALLLFRGISDRRARPIALFIHVFMAANAVIGLYEFLSGNRLIPFWLVGRVIDFDWRSTALLGHPLSNASITGSYCIILLLGGGRDLPRFARAVCLLLGSTSMVAFGGRAATLMLVASILLVTMQRALSYIRGRRFNITALMVGMLLLPVAGLMLIVLAEQGFFTRFIERFVDDQGSAETRLGMFELLFRFNLVDLLIAPDARHVETLQFHLGLEYGIESLWIAFILFYGLIPSLLFFAALFCFFRDIVRAARSEAAWVMLFFLAVASTSVSLYGKGPQFSILVIHILVLLRKSPAPRAALPAGNGAGKTAGSRPRLSIS